MKKRDKIRFLHTILIVSILALVLLLVPSDLTADVINPGSLDFIREDYDALGTINALAIEDVNSDNVKDVVAIVTYNFRPNLAIFQGPDYDLISFTEISYTPTHAIFTDLNNDNYKDLVIANQASKNIGIALGSYNGLEDFYYISTLNQFPTWLLAEDFNEDGCQDIAFTDFALSELIVNLGDCEGNLIFSQLISTGGGAQKVSAADFDNDGNLDLAVANQAFNNVMVTYGQGDGTFHRTRFFDVRFDAYIPTIADINNDNYPDIITGTHRSISILKNKGDGTFYYRYLLNLNRTRYLTEALNFNLDNDMDFVTAAADYELLGLFKGNGDGDFELVGYASTLTNPRMPIVEDIDNDNDEDVIIYGDDIIFSVYRNPIRNKFTIGNILSPFEDLF